MKMPNKKFLLPTILVIFAILLIARFYVMAQHHVNKPVTQIPPINVEVTTVKQKNIADRITAIGTLVANQVVNISPEIAGQVKEVYFNSGDTVKKGQRLIQLDDEINQAQLKAAQADLRTSQLKYERLSKLAKKGITSKQDLEAAAADYRDKQTDLQVAKVTSHKMLLKAPFDGVLGASKVNVGEYVSVGQGLVTIIDNKVLKVAYNVPERHLSHLSVGQRIRITTNAYKDKRFYGKVTFVSPSIDEDTRSIPVQADIPNPKGLLSPGLFVNIQQILGQYKTALLIPEQSLLPSIEGQKVFRVVAGKAVSTKVDVGIRERGMVEILKGLNPNDVVVTAGQQKLKDGANVKIISR